MNETLTFDFCDITIYDHYLIVVIKEGITLTHQYINTFIEITDTYYSDKIFVYITHRINSYSVNPEIYYKIAQIESLKGFAVVTSNYQAKTNAQIEKMFFKKPFEIFEKIEDAVAWADKLIGVN